MVPSDADNIRHEYDVLLGELSKFNPAMLQKHRILAVTKCDLIDDELIALLSEDLPKDLPVVFISAVTGQGLDQLKDTLWEELNSESNKLQALTEGGSIIHRDRTADAFAADFIDWQDLTPDTDEADDLEEYALEDLADADNDH